MKKIIFVIDQLGMGGIQKSLQELLWLISGQFDITLFSIKHYTNCPIKLPPSIRFISGNSIIQSSQSSLSELRKNWLGFIFRVIFSGLSKIFGHRIGGKILAKTNRIPGEYDIAISYTQSIEDHQFYNLSNEVVLFGVHASHKITYVHCDFANYGGDTAYNRKLILKFDNVVCVSMGVRNQLVQVFPEVLTKTRVVYNYSDSKAIQKMSRIDTVEYSKHPAFVSVCRLSHEKGLLRCIPIFHKLREDGFDFQWHIIGDGALYQSLKEEIKKYDLNDSIFLDGESQNPYSFMKNADCLLVPSFHEAAPMVYNEAMILGLYIISTDTLSAEEFVGSMQAGYICKNNENDIYFALKEYLTAPPAHVIKPFDSFYQKYSFTGFLQTII